MLANVRILRFDPSADARPYHKEYEYRFEDYMTVLDVLCQLAGEQDSSLCFHYCCRSGHCGLCGLLVNGKPYLSCHKAAENGMTLAPLPGFPVKRDLMIDRRPHEDARGKLRLFLERESSPDDPIETIDMARFAGFRQVSRCVECLCCTAVCPVWTNRPHLFVGPALLATEARLFYDSRDTQKRALISKSSGLEQCVGCGQCTRVCPQDADPAKAIADMRTN